MRYIIDNYVNVRWTEEDVELADQFYKTHGVGFTQFPFPKDLFLQFVRFNGGYFPVRIEALPEGTVANIHVPVYQIFAYKQYSRLVTFLETILTQVWYPTTVATLSRRTKEIIEVAFEQSVDPDMQFLADSRLHDFGFRGCTSVEQSVIGGVAHLLNFTGSDTMSACWYAQYRLNGGKPVATSIPATEHSVMTSWPNERLAMENMIDKFGGQNAVMAIVMDSYDYDNALNKVLPQVAPAHKKKGGMLVLRPDSGDPIECIVKALAAGEKTFGYTKNKKGFKVLNGISAIQGDGINFHTVKAILEATLNLGFSAQNVAFGMGGGLLQKVDRDTMQFATKLNYIIYKDGVHRNVMKRPKTDGGKFSLPGILQVRRENGLLWVHPREYNEKVDPATNVLKVVYDHGPVKNAWEDFDEVKARVAREWKATPRLHDPVGPEMKNKIKSWCANFDVEYDEMMAAIDAQQ
jgi:nicotinic acid phosphoribosyltransferase